MYKLLSRKLLGEKYSGAVKTIAIAAVIGFSLHSMGKTIPLAQSVLILTGIVYSGMIVIQVLSSKDNARCLRGLFAMPCDEKRTLWEYAAAVGAYTLFTKTSLLAALLFAFVKLTPFDILLFALSLIYALFGGMAAFAEYRKAPYISALIVGGGAAMAFLLPKGLAAAAVLAAADIVTIVIFSVQPFERFYLEPSSGVKAPVRRGKPKMLLLRYIARYMLENKNYIVSSIVIIAAGCIFSVTLEKQGLHMGCGIGLAMVSLNTPLATIVSSNRGLKKKLDALPDATRSFFVPYGLVLFGFYAISNAVFLTAFSVAGGMVGVKGLIMALLFAAETSVFVPLLENKFTVTSWKTEPDLWRNPRKYIIPAGLMLQGALISML
ncbi:MAG: hypothetical protein K6B74_09990 [Ruminococcus sp.]|nr:hypothetical protein [Ruminococcus sp.]